LNVYEINKRYYEIETLSNEVDMETGEFKYSKEEIAEMIAEIDESKNNKAEAICVLIDGAKNNQDYLDKEIKRLQAMKKREGKKEERLKGHLNFLLDGDSIQTNRFKVTYRKSEVTFVEDVKFLPPEYIKVKTSTEPDKTKLKKDIKDGKVEANEHFYIDRKQTLKVT